MEDFIDYILVLLLLLILLVTGLLIYLLFTAPGLAYLFMTVLIASVVFAIGIWLWRIKRKKRLGTYYTLFVAIRSAKQELMKAIKRLDRPLRQLYLPLAPKLNTLCKEAQQTLLKVQEIDTTFQTLDTRQPDQKSIHLLQASKIKYLHHIQQTIQFFQQTNTQIIALKHSQNRSTTERTITETLDELLIQIDTIKEIT